MRKTISTIFLFSVIVLAGEKRAEINVLESPAGAGSGEVWLCTHGGTLYMSWIEAEDRNRGTLLFAAYDGEHWDTPKEIFAGDDLFINWADFPKLAVTDKMMVAAWLQKLGSGTFAYGVRFAVSMDKGSSWSPPRWLHEDRSETEHGFVSLNPLDAETVAAVWLDGRAMAGPHGEGPMQLRSRTITLKGLGEEVLLDDRTCECCNTDLVSLGNDLFAAYRNQSKDQVRDIYLAKYRAGKWEKGFPVHGDNWQITGCPVNGPALDGRGKTLAVSWFTMVDGPRSQLKVSRDGGISFPYHTTFGKEPLGRLDCVVAENGRVAVTWLEAGESAGTVMVAFFRIHQGRLSEILTLPVDRTPSGRVSGFPRTVSFGNRLIIAYQDPDQPRIKLKQIHWPE